MRNDDERWLLSYYRHSEEQGARFFGRLARILRDPVRADLVRHAGDEQRHADWWEALLIDRNEGPIKLDRAYQDAYLEAAGVPANLMEVLALTHVFERRAAGQYARHRARPDLDPRTRDVLDRILVDEGRHLAWVRSALDRMSNEYGVDAIDVALRRYDAADREVYRCTWEELAERFPGLAPEWTSSESQ